MVGIMTIKGKRTRTGLEVSGWEIEQVEAEVDLTPLVDLYLDRMRRDGLLPTT